MKEIKLFFYSILTFLLFNSVAVANELEWVKKLSQDEFSDFSKEDNTVIIDVRTKGEYARGFIPGSINIPHKDIINGSVTLDTYKDKNIVFYCHTGVRVGIVNQYIKNNQSLSLDKVYHLVGDFRAWQARVKKIIRPK